MLTSIKDLQHIWPLLATYGTGQNVTVYNSIFTGPKQEWEKDGPQEMYVILLDNGRTNLLSDIHIRESAYCIRCGSCLNVCPVYKNIGGHAYETTYSGPIGSVISPHLKGLKDYKHLSNASSLCGNCTEACPVKINIHGMLHYNRTLAQDAGFTDNTEDLAWTLWRQAMLHRGIMDLAGAGIKNKIVNRIFKNTWGKRRDELIFQKSFKQMWKERQ
jgi:L-lactate dehydrogenase complex protein LldF